MATGKQQRIIIDGMAAALEGATTGTGSGLRTTTPAATTILPAAVEATGKAEHLKGGNAQESCRHRHDIAAALEGTTTGTGSGLRTTNARRTWAPLPTGNAQGAAASTGSYGYIIQPPPMASNNSKT